LFMCARCIELYTFFMCVRSIELYKLFLFVRSIELYTLFMCVRGIEFYTLFLCVRGIELYTFFMTSVKLDTPNTQAITPPMWFVLYEAAWTQPRHAFMSLRGRPFNF
jgi:hypothetical protein